MTRPVMAQKRAVAVFATAFPGKPGRTLAAGSLRSYVAANAATLASRPVSLVDVNETSNNDRPDD